jgi:hypothetical protein
LWQKVSVQQKNSKTQERPQAYEKGFIPTVRSEREVFKPCVLNAKPRRRNQYNRVALHQMKKNFSPEIANSNDGAVPNLFYWDCTKGDI